MRHTKKDYTKMAIQGSIVIFTFSVVSIILGFLLRTFLVKNLTVAEYGLLYAVLAFFGLFGLFRGAGLNPALVKYIPEFLVKNEKGKIKWSLVFTTIVQVTVATLTLSIILYFSPILSNSFFKTEASIPIIFFIGLSFASSVPFHLMQSAFQGFQKMKLYALLDPLRTAIVLAVSLFAIIPLQNSKMII